MGIRQAFGRRRGVPRDEHDGGGVGPDPQRRHQADPATGELIRTLGDPATGPAPDAGGLVAGGLVAGGLVVGNAEWHPPDVDLPDSYARGRPPADHTVVRQAWDLVADRSDALVRNFYAELFVLLGDDAFRMFPASMTAQRETFGRTLVQWVVADDPDTMTAHLARLGADHRKFDVVPAHYDLARQALVNAWRDLAGRAWTPAHEDAIGASYARLASTMIDGALAHHDEPASWGATVIGHDRLRPDFAVLRLQPDEPYPYKAGQYLTVELATRTREWRQMSIAGAPRADNTLDLHVRSTNATGVAASLVMHTGVGDRLRLGPPRGSGLVVDPRAFGPGGLLCVCAGTGAAPVVAVVESLLARPERIPVRVFVGARSVADLYPADLLTRTVRQAGRTEHVHVHGVVAQDPEWTGLRGRVEDVVPTLEDWAWLGVDVLVAGPDAMISTTVSALVGRGVPHEHIHFDQYATAH